MKIRITPLLFLAVSLTMVVTTSLSHAADACMGEGTFNLTSTATVVTPDGNFTIDFLFLINVTRIDSGYNISVLGKIVNITGPPVILQARVPLFDFAVSTDKGEYRWSDGKLFTAVMLPVSNGVTYGMRLQNIESSCIRSIVIDASGLGLHNLVIIGESGLWDNVRFGLAQSAETSSTHTTTRTSSPSYSMVTPTDTESSLYAKDLSVSAVYAGKGNAHAWEGSVERNLMAALIALLAALGVGLLLYTAFT